MFWLLEEDYQNVWTDKDETMCAKKQLGKFLKNSNINQWHFSFGVLKHPLHHFQLTIIFGSNIYFF